MSGRGSGQPGAGVVQSHTGSWFADSGWVSQLHWPSEYPQSRPSGVQSFP
jgi:hypothetical protein